MCTVVNNFDHRAHFYSFAIASSTSVERIIA